MKPDELLYIAYKDMIFANIKSGFLGQHISDSDYYVFDKYPELFLEVLDKYIDKYSTGGLIEKFYSLNKHRNQDIEFAKEVFKRLVDNKDFKILKEIFGEELFTSDIPLIKGAVKRLGGIFILNYGFDTLSSNEELRESLYDLDNFSLTWFKLLPPKNNELIESILTKDYHSYRMLSSEQKTNKEYILLALNSSLGCGASRNATVEQLYEHIPQEMKLDKDISMLAAKGKCIKQPRESFYYDNVFKTLLNSIYVKSDSNNNRNNFQLELLENLDFNMFEKKSNIEVLFNWLDEQKNYIKKDHHNYGTIHKLLKVFAKSDPYVKEQFNKKDSLWNQGNIGDTKYNNGGFFDKYFRESIPAMNNEFSYYMKAYNLRNELSNKGEITKERKIKI